MQVCTCNRIELVVLVVSIRVSLGLVAGAEGQNTPLHNASLIHTKLYVKRQILPNGLV
jgi:hypothetical protein